MIKRKHFWLGLVIGILIGFLYGWLSVWATYTVLERAHLERESELNAVKEIIFYSYDIHSQREEIIEWNQNAIKPAPEWAVGEEE